MKKIVSLLTAALLFFFLHGTSFACSVCKGGAGKEKLDAYILTTGILASMPIILCLFFFFVFRRAFKATDSKS